MRTWKIRLTALVLLVCLLLGGCERWNGELPNYYTPDYIPFSEMEYSRPNMAVLDTAIQEVEERVNSGVGFSSVVSSINYFLTCYYEYYTNLNLANIHYCADLTDTYWETEYYYCSELTPTVESKLDALYRFLAASSYREMLEGENYFGAGFFEYYDGESHWDNEFTSLMEEEARLQNCYYELSSQAQTVEYYSEEYFSQYGTQLAQLYVELIAVRQQIAAYLGYDSYADFAYENYFYRDYTAQEAERYFRMIGTQLRDVYIQVNQSAVWDGGTGVCTEEETFQYVKNAAEQMGDAVKYAFVMLEKGKLYDIAYGENKHDISFEIYLDSYNQPFIFTNPALQQGDKLVFAHEFGHFVNDYVCNGSYAGTDVCEVHSGAMEYLSLCYTENAEALEKYKLADSLCVYVEQSAYALFEQQVYELTGDELTVENVQKLYEQIGTDFGFDSWVWDHRDYVTVPHLFTYPMYVASYVVSNDLAFQIYQMEKAEPGEGLAVYKDCLESQDSYIMHFATTYGLEDPFTVQRVDAVRETFENALLPE